MFNKLIAIPAIMLSLLMIASCQPPSTETNGATTGSQIGDLAPDFQLQDLEGQTITLSNLRGSPVMLNFWATWCGPCRNEMPHIQEIYQTHSPSIEVLTINIKESQDKVREFMGSNHLSFPVLLDTLGSVALNYRVTGIPITVFIDKDGIIQARKLGAFSSAAEIESYLDEIMP